MAATDKFFRNQKALDMAFAVSSILMLVSVIMMLGQDYFREFKDEQRVFRDVEAKVAQRLALDQIPEAEEVDAAQKAVEDARKTREAKNSEVAELRNKVNALRPVKEKLDSNVLAIKADQESKISFLYIEIEEYGSTHPSGDAGDSKKAKELRDELKIIDGKLAEAISKRDDKAQEISEAQQRIDQIEEPLSTAVGKLKKMNDRFDTLVKLADKKKWSWGDSFRSLWLIEGFASPTKIYQITNNDYPINYNFKEVTRFDRCQTCHMGIDRPAHTVERLASLRDVTPEQVEKRDLALDQLKERRKALSGMPDAKQVPTGLKLGTISKSRLTDARIKEFAVHPRLDLFVGADSKHPMEKFGCTTCHAGQGSGTAFLWASHTPNTPAEGDKWKKEFGWFHLHAGDWEYPMLPKRFAESACVKCHHQMTDLIGSDDKNEAPKLLRGYNLVKENGCFGCHEIAGRRAGKDVGPDLRLESSPPYEALTPVEQARVDADPDTKPGSMRKVGPSLYRLAEKSNPEWTAKWIRAPREFRPDTKMPHFYGVSNNDKEALETAKKRFPEMVDQTQFPDAEIQAITYYLFQLSNGYLSDVEKAHKDDTAKAAAEDLSLRANLLAKGKLDAADKKSLAEAETRIALRKATVLSDIAGKHDADPKNGRKLFVERGCLACHSHEATEKEEAGSPAIVGEAIFGPNLSQVAGKLGRKNGDKASAMLWLTQWIVDPKVHSPRSRMPVTHLTPADAADVAAWLLAQPAMDQGSGWKDLTVAEPDITKLEDLAKVYLVRQLTKTNLKAFFDNKKLDDELVADLPVDEKTFIKDYSVKGKHALEMYVGKKGVGRQGCYGCHDIPGYETAKPIGVGLNDWGKKDASRLAYEDIDNFLEDHFYAVETLVNPDTKKPYGPREKTEGEGPDAKKVVKLPYEKFYKDAVEERFREGYLNQKLLDPRSYDYNRIRAWDDRARMPQFRFSRIRKNAGESAADFHARQMKEEAEAREAVMTFILGLVGEAAPDKMRNIPKGDRLAEVKGRQVLETFNCGGCHLIRPGEFKLKYDRVVPVLTSAAKVDRKADQTFPNHHLWTGTPQPNADYVKVHGLLPQPLFVSDDEDEEPKVRLRTMEAVRFQDLDKATHDIPAETLLSLEPKDFVLPSSIASASRAEIDKYLTSRSYGGTFGNLLVGYLETKDPKKFTKDAGLGDSSPARPFVPPSLVGLGEKGNPDWVYNYVRDPYQVRKMTLMRMPKFSLSPEDARSLADYFGGVERIRNPNIGLTFPFEQGGVTEAYLKQKSAEYVARLKAANAGKESMFERRVAELTPVWKAVLDDYEKRKKVAASNFDKLAPKLKEATTKEKDAKDALDAAKKAKKDEAELQKKYDAAKSEFDDVTRLSESWERETKALTAKIDESSVEKQKATWMEKDAYLTDGFKLVANKTLCINCHSIGAYETKNEIQGPRLDEVYKRLRPGWVERWIANPTRHVPYASSMPPYFPADLPPSQFAEFFVGTPREKVQAVRDVLMTYPETHQLSANRYWTLPLVGDVK
jgi:cytochrome c2